MTISTGSGNQSVAFPQERPLAYEVDQSEAGSLPRRGDTADIGLR
jgi:hypothetical protein